MQIRGESEGEVGEEGSGGGGVEVARRRSTWNEAMEEADGDGRDEAEEEAEHGDRYSDGGGHGIHLRQLHIGRNFAVVNLSLVGEGVCWSHGSCRVCIYWLLAYCTREFIFGLLVYFIYFSKPTHLVSSLFLGG